MNNSILQTVKLMLGLEPTYTAFDEEIKAHINMVLMILSEIGICEGGFYITGNNETWTDLLDDREDLEGVKTYIYLKVKMLFDPPNTQTVAESLRNTIQELEWRLYSKTGFLGKEE